MHPPDNATKLVLPRTPGQREMTSMQSNCKGVAVVTGSGQGIGHRIALRLAGDGYDVVINDLESNKENLDAVKKEIIDNFPERRVLIILANVTVEEEVKGLVESAVEEFGKLSVVSYLLFKCLNADLTIYDDSSLQTQALSERNHSWKVNF